MKWSILKIAVWIILFRWFTSDHRETNERKWTIREKRRGYRILDDGTIELLSD